jgi:hypothetical protein
MYKILFKKLEVSDRLSDLVRGVKTILKIFLKKHYGVEWIPLSQVNAQWKNLLKAIMRLQSHERQRI